VAQVAVIGRGIGVKNDLIGGATMKKLGRATFLVILMLILSIGILAACDDNDHNQDDNNGNGSLQSKPCVEFVIDGEVYSSVEADDNGYVAIPADIAKEGYEFVGWFLDNGTWEKPFTEDTLRNNPVKSDTKVYAYFEKKHQHTFESKWSYSENYHWHKSDCGHNLFADQAKHTFDDSGVCTVCGYKYSELQGVDIKTNTLTNDGYNIGGKVSNSTTTFSFEDEITVADGAIYTVSTDGNGLQVIESKTVELEIGDNCFYIILQNKKTIKQYKVVIRRRPRYMVTFDTNGGTSAVRQYVEEDGFVSMPNTTKTGYTVSWSYDFSQPITNDEHIVASWEIVHYTIEYDWNGGEVNPNNPTSYTVEDEITLPAPTKVGYTGYWVNNGGKIEKGSTGNKVFTAEYAINKYNVTIEPSIENSCTMTSGGAYNYNSEITASVSDVYIGYEFIGFFDGDTCLTTEKTYKFNVPAHDVSIVAKFEVKSELQGFTFTSDTENCMITGVEDKTVESVVIPDCVTFIGANAFSDCTNLTNIDVPSNVLGIEYGAFSGCSELTDVTLHEGLIGIGKCAFQNCAKLTSITIPDTVLSVNSHTFLGCSNLSSVKIGSGVTFIDIFAFDKCVNLTSIDIPNSVTSIGNEAFSNCSQLETVTLHEGLLTIGSRAFRKCEKLTSIVIPDTVTEIGKFAFSGCVNLTSVKIGNGVTEIENFVFRLCSSLTDVTIGKSVAKIGNQAFYGCSSLTNVTIPSSVTSIGEQAFYNCDALTSVKYEGTMAQWAEITLGTDWSTTVTQIICTDGTITYTTEE